MPYIYAIQEMIYEDGIPPGQGEWKKPDRIEYHPVSQDIAETHENGLYKLVSMYGKEMSGWQYFYNEYREADNTKVGGGKPLGDAIGNLLEAGDLVMATQSNKTALHVMEIVSFTPKKVRVRNVGSYGAGTIKDPTDVIKVDKSHFF